MKSDDNGRMKIGYARISSIDQNPDMQLAALKKAGCEKIFTDKMPGATTERPQLQRCLKKLEEGDKLIVWKLDRLARSTRDLVNLVERLKDGGVEFQSLTEEINTSTASGRLTFHLFQIFLSHHPLRKFFA